MPVSAVGGAEGRVGGTWWGCGAGCEVTFCEMGMHMYMRCAWKNMHVQDLRHESVGLR